MLLSFDEVASIHERLGSRPDADDDLQRATVAENEALVTNAKLAYDRARVLLERAVGSQKGFTHLKANRRDKNIIHGYCEARA